MEIMELTVQLDMLSHLVCYNMLILELVIMVVIFATYITLKAQDERL